MVNVIEKGDLARILNWFVVEEKKPRKMPDLSPLLPLWAEAAAFLSTGGGGEEAAFETSLQSGVDVADQQRTIAEAQEAGFTSEEIAGALVDLTTLRIRAFGDLSSCSIEAAVVVLAAKIETIVEVNQPEGELVG